MEEDFQKKLEGAKERRKRKIFLIIGFMFIILLAPFLIFIKLDLFNRNRSKISCNSSSQQSVHLDKARATLQFPCAWKFKYEHEFANWGGEAGPYRIGKMHYSIYCIDKNLECEIKDLNIQGSLVAYNLPLWLKTLDYVTPGDLREPSTPPKEARREFINLLDEIYTSKILPSDFEKRTSPHLNPFYGNEEFAITTIDPRYFESNDKQSRGFSVLSIGKEKIGIFAPTYTIFLYNSKENVLIEFKYYINVFSYPEIESLQTRLDNGFTGEELQSVSDQVKIDFKLLIENSKRSSLSFGSILDIIDTSMMTLTFGQ